MAEYEEFTIDQGSDVAIELELVDHTGAAKDLVGHTVTATMKKSYSDSAGEATAFNSIVSDPATSGVVNLSLTSTQTSALSKGRYVYDVELSFIDDSSNTIVERILEGRIQVTPSVT